MQNANNNSRIYGLDILRASAITYVMLSHGYVFSAHVIPVSYYKYLLLDGVGIFFVLSGFLIGGILIRKIETEHFNRSELFSFWIRRWMRTLPAYFFVLSLYIILYYLHRNHLPPSWAKYYLFTQNLISPHPTFFAEAWSLSVEEWFYFLVPLFLFLILKIPISKRYLILFCIVLVIVAVTFLRLYKVSQHNYIVIDTFGEDILKVVVTRMDAIMYGVLAAWMCIYFKNIVYPFKNMLFLIGLLLLFIPNFFFSPFFHTKIQYTLNPIAISFLLPWLSTYTSGKGKIYTSITFISTISYSMYLCNHMLVLRGLIPMLLKWLNLNLNVNPINNTIAYLLFWTLTIITAYGLYRFIEKPFMNLRENIKLK